jgi:hypothetical protein
MKTTYFLLGGNFELYDQKFLSRILDLIPDKDGDEDNRITLSVMPYASVADDDISRDYVYHLMSKDIAQRFNNAVKKDRKVYFYAPNKQKYTIEDAIRWSDIVVFTDGDPLLLEKAIVNEMGSIALENALKGKVVVAIGQSAGMLSYYYYNHSLARYDAGLDIIDLIIATPHSEEFSDVGLYDNRSESLYFIPEGGYICVYKYDKNQGV